ncbi:hypothetical protein Bbelb_289890 [Branchiostoma belcheri]|nr:hypothetical protein Bbelb_289890 [Branchiostoma belcheri]
MVATDCAFVFTTTSSPAVSYHLPAEAEKSDLKTYKFCHIYVAKPGLAISGSSSEDRPPGLFPVARCSRHINHTQTLQAIASRTNFYRLSFFPRAIREWNELESGAAEAGSLAQFKSELARTLLH